MSPSNVNTGFSQVSKRERFTSDWDLPCHDLWRRVSMCYLIETFCEASIKVQ